MEMYKKSIIEVECGQLTLSDLRELVDSLGSLEELCLELRELETRVLKLLVFVRDTAPDKAETRRGLLPRIWGGLVAKVALDKRPHLLLRYQDRILTYPRQPPLQHNPHEPIVLLVRGRRRLREGQSRNNRLGVIVYDSIVELLELKVRARDVAVRRACKVREIRLCGHARRVRKNRRAKASGGGRRT